MVHGRLIRDSYTQQVDSTMRSISQTLLFLIVSGASSSFAQPASQANIPTAPANVIFEKDIAYREGSIYAAISSSEQFWLSNSIVMTGVLLMGLIYRQRHGPGNIGLESVVLLLLYFGGLVVLSV